MNAASREAILWALVLALGLLLARSTYLYNDLANLFWQQAVLLQRTTALCGASG